MRHILFLWASIVLDVFWINLEYCYISSVCLFLANHLAVVTFTLSHIMLLMFLHSHPFSQRPIIHVHGDHSSWLIAMCKCLCFHCDGVRHHVVYPYHCNTICFHSVTHVYFEVCLLALTLSLYSTVCLFLSQRKLVQS